MSRGLYERLCDIKERCEQPVADVHGDPESVAGDRVPAKAVLYDLHVIGEACGMLPPELQARHPEVNWKGWVDFRNLSTHQYWRADATIAAEAMERAVPLLVALVAAELPAAPRPLAWTLGRRSCAGRWPRWGCSRTPTKRWPSGDAASVEAAQASDHYPFRARPRHIPCLGCSAPRPDSETNRRLCPPAGHGNVWSGRPPEQVSAARRDPG